MLRVAMSSTKNMLDFGLNFLSKTCLWGMTKLFLFDVLFLYQFWIKFGSILTALDTQNPSKMRGHPWLDRLLTLTEWLFHKNFQEFLNIGLWPSLNHCSKIDFWLILEPPRRLQDLSKAAQDASRRLQNDVKTLPRRLKTPLDTSKTGSDPVHFWQETFLSWQRTMNRSESTKYSSQFTIYSFIFTNHNLQVRVSSSAFTVHC